jgi:hypothetical protein
VQIEAMKGELAEARDVLVSAVEADSYDDRQAARELANLAESDEDDDMAAR